MNTYSKILTALIVSFIFIISSCTKEEQIIEGCTDSTAMNYNSTATSNDGSCVYCVYGCIDSTQFNYNPLATCDDGSCIYPDGIYPIGATGPAGGFIFYDKVW